MCYALYCRKREDDDDVEDETDVDDEYDSYGDSEEETES